MAFQYNPLPHPDREIRVAVIQPGRFNTNLRVNFIARRLDEDNPGYEALSYVWGSEKNPLNVEVDSGLHSGAISITQNLDVALRHLRLKKKARYLWIDALCIDQKNSQEKSVQVKNMGFVYARAERTISWLGPEEDNTARAIALLHNIAHNVEVNWNGYGMRPSESSIKALEKSGFFTHPRKKKQRRWAARWGIASDLVPWTAQETDCVYSLLQRPYFGRAWIQQEIQLSKHVMFQCGLQILPENILWASIYCLYVKPITFEQSIIRNKARSRVYSICSRRMRSRGLTYGDLRYMMRNFHCRDPRDKIYAALSLLNPKDKGLDVQPDYSLDARTIFTDIARRKIELHHTLELLEACELSTKSADIPSWVPDWSSRSKHGVPMFRIWSTCGFISAQVSLDTNESCCIASGIRVAGITSVTENFLNENQRSLVDLIPFFQAIKPSEEVLHDQYLTGENLVEAYCRTLVTDMFRTNVPNVTRLDHGMEFLKVMWSNDPRLDHPDIEKLPQTYLLTTYGYLIGRCFLKTAEGHIGLAPTETRPGDVVCVLLGSNFPVTLRPLEDSDACRRWLVVGTCYVHGLMDGETIYRGKHTAQYESVLGVQVEDEDTIDGQRVAFRDETTGMFRTNPAELMEDAGIKVESYQRKPHKLNVLPKTLRAAGIPLEDFVLV